MTVKELKEELDKYPDNLIVYGDDYEYGMDEITEIDVVEHDKFNGAGLKTTINVLRLR